MNSILKAKDYILGIQVSLDGSSWKTHGFLRRNVKGQPEKKLFDKAINSIKSFVNNGLRTSIATCIHPQNINEIDALKQEKDGLMSEVEELKATFAKIEDEKLSSLRTQVMELSKKANFGLTEEEIADMGEPALNRYIEGFSQQLKHMVKIEEPIKEQDVHQYQEESSEDVKLSESLTQRLTQIRG